MGQPFCKAAWLLYLSPSTLIDWNNMFDEKMKSLKKPENRGKASKVTIENVRRVVEEAQKRIQQGKKIILKRFTKELVKVGVDLSATTVGEILIANNLREVKTRRKRPRFYRSLRQRIPNGLLGVDGSVFIVWLDDEPFKFNVELAVDIGTFAHTAFSISDSETSEEILKVFEAHRKMWGCPLGFLSDSGTANLSDMVTNHIQSLGVELVPAGPNNAKGNGTLEGAFSQIKEIIGKVRLDMSSKRSLAKSVLEALISIYIKMRNRQSIRNETTPPLQKIQTPSDPKSVEQERQRLRVHKKSKAKSKEEQAKVDRLRTMIKAMEIKDEPEVLKRAEKTITYYEMWTVIEAEKAFVKAVNRKPERLNLSYFFGILWNKQQDRDDAAYAEHCRKRYNLEILIENQRREQAEKPPTVEGILGLLKKGVLDSAPIVKRIAILGARSLTEELAEKSRYTGSLLKKFIEGIKELTDLSLEQKEKALEYVNDFLNLKPEEKCVTLFS